MQLKIELYAKEELHSVFPQKWNTETSGIYFLFNKSSEVIYIGKATNLYARLYNHLFGSYAHTAFFRDEMFRFGYLLIEEEQELETVEKYMIRLFKPIYNVLNNGNTKERIEKKPVYSYDDSLLERAAKEKGFKTVDDYEEHLYELFGGL